MFLGEKMALAEGETVVDLKVSGVKGECGSRLKFSHLKVIYMLVIHFSEMVHYCGFVKGTKLMLLIKFMNT